MLLQTLLAAHLILVAGSAVASAPVSQDESITLPIAWSEERSTHFVSLLPQNPNAQSPSPTPSSNSPANDPQPKPPANLPSPAQSTAARLREDLRKHYGNIVTVKLQSRRTIEGKLASSDNESFSLQSGKHSKPVKIRYSEVLGQPKFRPSVNQVFGRTFFVAGCILAIPAAPFLFLAIASGALAD
ncbi:MAG: hypothetical protein ABSG69_03465 [Candidatus Acidiferrum sp.]|jgi:hypothetical protein